VFGCDRGAEVSRLEKATDLDDATAVALARAGDLDAYEVLVAHYTAAAHRAAVLLGAGADADDVVQEAFVKAYRGLGGFREGAAFRPWLLRIVANETRNAVRARGRRVRREELAAPLDVVLDPADAAVSLERRTELLNAVRTLPEPMRLVVTCRYLLDLDEQETAVVLGWPRGTVKSRLHRALGRLRDALPDKEVQR
jgi:RNA polymerase sigma-70 factor (ECF subfamily)